MSKPNQNIFQSMDFTNLMQYKITNILLVCSAYDQFTLEEDGRLELQIANEYWQLSLSNAPRFRQVCSAAEAMDALRSGRKFDLIITMFNIGEVDPFAFSHLLKAEFGDIPLVLLTSFSREVNRRLQCEDTSHIDYVFSWQGNTDLILAIIKMLEDKHNAAHDMLQVGVQGILLVEDSIRFYSAYLPDLYMLILQQTHDFIKEALNEHQRFLRKRARPKILFARTYSEALGIYDQYKNNLLGIISDVSYNRDSLQGEYFEMAGIELCREVHSTDRRMPFLLQSSEQKMSQFAMDVGAEFVNKHSKTLFQELAGFINRRMAFGDFVFKDPHTKVELFRADGLKELQMAVEVLPVEVLVHYASQNMFSRWLNARGLFSIAAKIKVVDVDSFDDKELLRGYLVDSIEAYRRQSGLGIVAEFDANSYNKYISFSRSGGGSLGGKARGLAFVGSMLEEYELHNRWKGVRVTIPRTMVVATDNFDNFMQENRLEYIITEPLDDDRILAEFIDSRLSNELLDNIRAFVSSTSAPLAVRSSSKLEDSHYQPFAGIYSTYMVPHIDQDERMVRMVAKAIKSVYASVFFRASRSYIDATSNVIAQEKMGVVIQEVCGTEQDGYFFPTLSGVARSINFYPIGDEKPEDGVVNVALGLGKAVVEGGTTLRFSPKYPRHALQLSSQEITLRDTQKHFYALDLNPASLITSTDDTVNLRRFDLQEATSMRNLRHVCSTWDFQNERITHGPLDKGPKIVTFNNILRFDTFPLAEIVSKLLEIGTEQMKSPVEIEFAVNMDVEPGQEMVFNFLQIRPIVENTSTETIDWENADLSGALVYAQSALGTGRIGGLRDVIYVRSDRFDPGRSKEMAAELEQINDTYKSDDTHYILIGPGRWGSSDPWLGIPVKWSQISQSRVIAECGLENFRVDPSQGTHFFQNLTSFGVGYLTMNPFLGDGKVDTARLDAMEAVYESEFFRVVRFDHPLYVFVDGKNNKAIIEESRITDQMLENV